MGNRCVIEKPGQNARRAPLNLLENCSVDLNLNEPHALAGRNGSGKTTLCRVLAGLYQVNREAIQWRVMGEDAPRIGYLPSKGGLKSDLPIKENVALLANLGATNITPSGVKDWFRANNLPSITEKTPEEISFGQVQIARMAAILLSNPDVLILDEPTTGLDIEMCHIIETLIADKSANGVATIIATHDMETIHALCYSITILDQGRPIYSGTVDAMKERFPAKTLKQSYWQLLKGSA